MHFKLWRPWLTRIKTVFSVGWDFGGIIAEITDSKVLAIGMGVFAERRQDKACIPNRPPGGFHANQHLESSGFLTIY
jgi:hypothetical protein